MECSKFIEFLGARARCHVSDDVFGQPEPAETTSRSLPASSLCSCCLKVLSPELGVQSNRILLSRFSWSPDSPLPSLPRAPNLRCCLQSKPILLPSIHSSCHSRHNDLVLQPGKCHGIMSAPSTPAYAVACGEALLTATGRSTNPPLTGLCPPRAGDGGLHGPHPPAPLHC